MATTITIPQLGESLTEAVIAAWLKAEGAYVERDEEIVELETDKVTMPLPSPAAGIIHHTASEGDTVEIGAVIGTIDESAKKPKKSANAKKTAAAKGGSSKQDAATAPVATEEPPVPLTTDAPRITPLARKIADENHLDLSEVIGTGPGGRIREQDVLALVHANANGAAPSQTAATPTPTDSPAPTGPTGFPRTVRRQRMSQLRQRIATRLVEAQQTAAMLTTFNECDMTAVMSLRARHKDQFLKKHDVKLGFMSFFVKASCSALARYPDVNAYLVRADKGAGGGMEFEHHDYCDLAVAVGTEKGLVVPVLRNAESLSFADIEKGIGALAAKARDGSLTLEDMQGGTFTISNGGVYGSMLSTPILNPPQSAILGMHNIIRRPIEDPSKPGSGEIAVRPMMYLALSYDHRVVDGEGAVGFLKHIKECLEDPERLLLDV